MGLRERQERKIFEVQVECHARKAKSDAETRRWEPFQSALMCWAGAAGSSSRQASSMRLLHDAKSDMPNRNRKL